MVRILESLTVLGCFLVLLIGLLVAAQANLLAVDWFLAYWVCCTSCPAMGSISQVELDDDDRSDSRNVMIYGQRLVMPTVC